MTSNYDPSVLKNTIFLGEVASVHNYGAFVQMPGSPHQGLVHRTQVSSSAVEDVTEVLQKGERIWCKVINITDDGKVGLSMKVVDQGNGVDLDPNGVQIHQDEQRRRSQPMGSRRKVIELEAVLNTTCTKCGTKGHLAKDCFKTLDGKTYELIPEEEEEEEEIPQIRQVPTVQSIEDKLSKNKNKEKKKDKEERRRKRKEKKTKKRKKHDSSPEVSDSGSEPVKLAKKRKRSHDERRNDDRKREKSSKKKIHK